MVTSDQIEKRSTKIIETFPNHLACDQSEFVYLEKWVKRQSQGKPIDPDLLSLRTLETLILLAIVNFSYNIEESNDLFEILENKLMDWSEAMGLIRSLSDTRFNLADNSMDIEFNSVADPSQTSAIFTLKQNEFDAYLLQKFNGVKRANEIVDIVAERCGIPTDTDFEDEKQSTKLPVAATNKKPSIFTSEQSKNVI